MKNGSANGNAKLLCARLKGGIGNQLFIYAYAKTVSIQTGRVLVLDTVTGFLRDEYLRKPLVQELVRAEKIADGYLRFLSMIARKLPQLAKTFFSAVSYREADSHVYEDPAVVKNIEANYLFLEGYFQSYRYSAAYLKEIRSAIRFPGAGDLYIQELLTRIQSSAAVAVHVRRVQYEDLLDSTYYHAAIQLIEAKVSQPTYFFFSDDIAWCRDAFADLANAVFVKNTTDSEVADLWLMTQCRHFIIANSSFSWWGAYLSDKNDKIVVAPAKTAIGVKNQLYPEQWILI